MNRVFYAINQPIDRFIFRPPAMVYGAMVPPPVREGVRNALANIYSPVTFLNDVVQLRPKRALNTLGRFLINSTLGIGGLFDIAKRKPFHLQGHTNSFSNTLAMLGDLGPLSLSALHRPHQLPRSARAAIPSPSPAGQPRLQQAGTHRGQSAPAQGEVLQLALRSPPSAWCWRRSARWTAGPRPMRN
jgi:phospholipid-binding lipoprotein MlaA